MPSKGGRSLKLEELARHLGEAKRLPDLEVEAGETRILTLQSADMRKYFTTIEVEDAAQLKDLIGVPDDVDRAGTPSRAVEFDRPTPGEARPVGAESLRAMPARTISPAILTDAGVEPEVKLEAAAIARAATERYLFGNSGEVRLHEGLINAYLKQSGAKIFVPVFNDITVQNNAILQVVASILAVWANRIRLYGSGAIVCRGPTTFDCRSFQGNLPAGGSAVAPGGLTIPARPIEPF